MKRMFLFFILGLVGGLSSLAVAVEKVEGPYEAQLRNYTGMHDGLMQKMDENNLEKILENEKLRITAIQLSKQYKKFQQNIKAKEADVVRLKSLNKKISKEHAKIQGRYVELEGLFKAKKAETERLKSEVDRVKASFYQKMIKAYEEESAHLDEVLQKEGRVLNGKIDTLKERQEEVKVKLKEIKFELDEL